MYPIGLEVRCNALKSIFYKNDLAKSFKSKIPQFLPRFFVNITYPKQCQSQLLKVIQILFIEIGLKIYRKYASFDRNLTRNQMINFVLLAIRKLANHI